jgi:hypothetical protein
VIVFTGSLVVACLHSSRHYSFLVKNVATRQMDYIPLKALFCVTVRHHQIGLYTWECLIGGKKITSVLNHGFLVSLWRAGRTLNEEYYDTDCTLQLLKTFQSSTWVCLWFVAIDWEGGCHRRRHLTSCTMRHLAEMLLKFPLWEQIFSPTQLSLCFRNQNDVTKTEVGETGSSVLTLHFTARGLS